MKLYSIYLPKKYNDKTTIPAKEIRKVTKIIIERFGSYSADPHAKLPIMQGSWTSKTNRLFNESMTLVQIFTPDTFDVQKWIKSMQEVWRQALKQESLFIIEQHAELISGKE